MPPTVRVAVIIPALDEERSLPFVLEGLSGAALGLTRDGRTIELAETLVIDNASGDATALVASRHGATVLYEPERGYGRCCLRGITYLERSRPEIVAFLDADFSDDPTRLAEIVEPIASGDSDIVIGSRTLGTCEPGGLPPQARHGNRLAVWLIRILYGHRYTDLGPFRAISATALASLRMRDPGYGWTAEMQVKAILNNLRISEIPVPYRRRIGTSKISGTLQGTIKAGSKIIWTILYYRFKRGVPGNLGSDQ